MADVLKKVPVREQDAKVRATNFEEVCLEMSNTDKNNLKKELDKKAENKIKKELDSYQKKLNNKLENVNVSPFTFFYISKLFKINKLMDVR